MHGHTNIKQIVYCCRRTEQYISFLVYLILMATCFGLADRHPAILCRHYSKN